MRVLLINPPQTFFQASQPVAAGPPLGIMYLAAVLEREGYNVEILDALIADFPSQTEADRIQYGMPWNKMTEEIKKRKPDVVGVTCPFTAQSNNAIKTAQIVKDVDPRIHVVVGGPHTSVRPVEFLRDAPCADIAVIGEGEYTMLDIIKYFEGKKSISEIDGVAYRKDGKVILNKRRTFIADLDALPFPAYHLVDMEKYLNPKRIRYRMARYSREIPLVTSRGCPYNCVFCSIHLHMGKKWRSHSKNYIISHIEYLINMYGISHIHFEDDNITLNKKRFEDIIDCLLNRNIKITWDTPNGIRADGLDMKIFRKMKQSGCIKLIIGVESGDQWVLDNIVNKNLRLQDVFNTAKICKEIGIKLSAFFIIGFPGEKKAHIERTIEFALRLKKKFGVNMNLLIATPLFGTKLYDICQERGYLIQELTDRTISEATQTYGKGLIKTEEFTPEDLHKLAYSCLIRYRRLSLFDFIKDPKSTLSKVWHSPMDIVVFLGRLPELIKG